MNKNGLVNRIYEAGIHLGIQVFSNEGNKVKLYNQFRSINYPCQFGSSISDYDLRYEVAGSYPTGDVFFYFFKQHNFFGFNCF